GAAGFIGTALCRTLAHSGAEVHGTSRSRREPTSEVRWWTVDLSDQQTAAQIFRAVEPELVVHLASHVNGDRSLAAVHPTFRDNLCTTVNVLTAASTTSRPRVILAGSMEEPGADEIGIPPSSPYAAAKSAASIYAELFHTLYDLP